MVSSRIAHSGSPLATATLALVVAAGCGQGPPPEPEGDDDVTEDLPHRFGLLNVVETAGSAEVHAVFSAALPETGVIDGLAWIGVGDPGHGYWIPPGDPGELVPVADLEAAFFWPDDRYLDVGELIEVGGVTAPRIQGWTDPDGFEGDGLIYYRDEGGHPPGELGTLQHVGFGWPGSADVAGESRPGAVQRIDALELTSHDADQVLLWYEDDDVELSWSEGAGGEVWVTVLGDLGWLQARVVAGDAFDVLAAILREAIEERAEIRVGRVAREVVPAAHGEIVYHYAREQRLTVQRSGALSVSPGTVRLDQELDLVVNRHDGTFVEGATEFDLGPGIQVLATQIDDGTTATLRIAVEAGAATGLRDVSASTPDGSVNSARALRVLLPEADTCVTAFTLPGPGTYHGRLGGLVDDHPDPSACTGYPAGGPDAVFGIQVDDGVFMAATLHYPEVDSVLYMAPDCDGLIQPVACSDAGGLNAAETFSYSPLPGEGGSFLLVADSIGDLDEPPDVDFELVFELLGP